MAHKLERKLNTFDLHTASGSRIGIEIGEEGYAVCDEETGLCPVSGVQDLSVAYELQEIMSKEQEDRQIARHQFDLQMESSHRIGIEIGEEGYAVCDEETGFCPVSGVQDLSVAYELQQLMSKEQENRLGVRPV